MRRITSIITCLAILIFVASAKLVSSETVQSDAPTLTSLSMTDFYTLVGGSKAQYVAYAWFSDSTYAKVAPVWSLSPANTPYASIDSLGVLTTAPVTSNQTIAVIANYTSGGLTKTTYRMEVITPSSSTTSTSTSPPATVTLTGLSIDGTSSVVGGGTASFSATAKFSDATTTVVTPVWSVYPAATTFASIDSAGKLTTTAVTGNQTIAVIADYTSGGVSKKESHVISITVPTTTSTSGSTGKAACSGTYSVPLGEGGALSFEINRTTNPLTEEDTLSGKFTQSHDSLTGSISGFVDSAGRCFISLTFKNHPKFCSGIYAGKLDEIVDGSGTKGQFNFGGGYGCHDPLGAVNASLAKN